MKNPLIEHLGPMLSKDSFFSKVNQLKLDSILYPEVDEPQKEKKQKNTEGNPKPTENPLI
ncbi:MAG: hypothetical protein DSY77_04360 [Bacteroidetes bacterium]|nr:MAG: hypothetical protein DSY77_04360 [Bacteroidota bacterium]